MAWTSTRRQISRALKNAHSMYKQSHQSDTMSRCTDCQRYSYFRRGHKLGAGTSWGECRAHNKAGRQMMPEGNNSEVRAGWHSLGNCLESFTALFRWNFLVVQQCINSDLLQSLCCCVGCSNAAGKDQNALFCVVAFQQVADGVLHDANNLCMCQGLSCCQGISITCLLV